MPVHAYQVATAVVLLDLRVDLARLGPLSLVQHLCSLGDPGNEEHRYRHRDQCDQGEHRRDDEHHRQDAEDGEHRRQERGQRRRQRRRDVVDVVGDAAEDLAARCLVEIRKGETVKLRLHRGTQVVDGLLDDDVEEECFQPGKQRREQVHADREHDDFADGVEVQTHTGNDVGRVGDKIGERRIP